MRNRRVKSLLKDMVVCCASSALGQGVAAHLHRNMTAFIMYHGVSRDSEELESTTFVKESQFRRQMEFVRAAFDCLTIDEALERDGSAIRRPGVVITFDDGYANNADIALPILEAFEIPAVIYITTRNVLERRLFWPDEVWIAVKRSGVREIDLSGIVETLRKYRFYGHGAQWQTAVHDLMEDLKRTHPSRRAEVVDAVVQRFRETAGAKYFEMEPESNLFTPLTKKQVEALSSHPLITIGSHSHCHNLLNQIPLSQAKESILTSKEILERLTRRKIEHFSYPNGNLTPEIMCVLRDLGFRSAVSVPPGYFAPGDNPFFIKRFMPGAYMSLNTFKAMLTGIFSLRRRLGF
jgi:peptidoglycan/xylan/chitin deacetylase (PgdA/CDA1 family)